MTLPVCVMTCVIGRARPRKSRMICIKRCGNTRLINELRVLAHFIKEVEGAVSFLWYRSHRGATPYRGVAWRGYRGIARFLLRCHRIPPRAFILCGNLRNSCAQFPFDACNSIQLQTHKEETRSAAFFFVPLTFKSAFHSQAKWPFNVCLKCTFVMWNERWITALLIFPLPFSSFLFFFWYIGTSILADEKSSDNIGFYFSWKICIIFYNSFHYIL